MDTHDTSTSSFTRRRILGLGGAGAVGGLACYFGWPSNETPQTRASATPHAATPASPPQPMETAASESAPAAGALRRDDFLPHLKSEFRLESAGTGCKLVEVGAAQKLVSPTAEYVSFALLFTAPAGAVIESRIHQLSHAEMETLDLFISPVGQSKEHVYLEAVCCQRA